MRTLLKKFDIKHEVNDFTIPISNLIGANAYWLGYQEMLFVWDRKDGFLFIVFILDRSEDPTNVPWIDKYDLVVRSTSVMDNALSCLLERIERRKKRSMRFADGDEFNGAGMDVEQVFGFITGGRFVNLHEHRIRSNPVKVYKDLWGQFRVCSNMIVSKKGFKKDEMLVLLGAGCTIENALANAKMNVSRMRDSVHQIEQYVFDKYVLENKK